MEFRSGDRAGLAEAKSASEEDLSTLAIDTAGLPERGCSARLC